MTPLLVLLALLAAGDPAPPRGAPAPPPPDEPGSAEPPAVTFTKDVSPLLERWCVHCHGADEQHGGLRLDSFEAVMRGGDHGPPVVARDPERSLLIAKVERKDRPAMPPRKRLPSSVVAKLKAWVADGARP